MTLKPQRHDRLPNLWFFFILHFLYILQTFMFFSQTHVILSFLLVWSIGLSITPLCPLSLPYNPSSYV